LRDESFNIFAFRVSIDFITYLDATEAIADVAVDAEDAWMSMFPSIVAVTERSWMLRS
jgi:hypothetical protein